MHYFLRLVHASVPRPFPCLMLLQTVIQIVSVARVVASVFAEENINVVGH